jgi:bifunctional enzyme CysN/CysC
VRDVLRFAIAGSVDDGKSTLLGRLLYDTKTLFEDQLEAVTLTSRARGDEYTNLALLTDGLRAEREQGITIDVAYRYFATPKRKFIAADTPGHIQYTRNMVTGASNADLALVLIDARKGMTEQSRRHTFLSALLGIPHLVVCINKMDLVDWSGERFDSIRTEFEQFASRLEVHDVTFVPVCALHGDNVVNGSYHMPWYSGSPLLTHLETVYVGSDPNLIDPRFPVQYVIRPISEEHHDFRGYAGTMASGVFRTGDEVVVLPSGLTSYIESIHAPSGPVQEAFASMAVTITLADQLSITRGDLLCRPNNQPQVSQEIDATLCWFNDASEFTPGANYLLKHTTNTVSANVTALHYRLDVNTLHRDESAQTLAMNEIGRVSLRTTEAIFFDEYHQNRTTGSFILIDPRTNATVGAGIIRRMLRPTASTNVRWQAGGVSRGARESTFGSVGSTVWLTGLSGSGKSSVAAATERRLIARGIPAYVLDGDNLRHGLNGDLDFSEAGRSEAVRRTGEVARLFADAGLTVIVALISPNAEDRHAMRELHEDIGISFSEVFVNTPLEECERRDEKGLYARARAGELASFTGINAPYEAPTNPDLELPFDGRDAEQLAEYLVAFLESRTPTAEF